jgi:hypothetical protein
MADLISEEDMVTMDTVTMDMVTMDMVTTDMVTENLISDEIDFNNAFRITKRTCIVNT